MAEIFYNILDNNNIIEFDFTCSTIKKDCKDILDKMCELNISEANNLCDANLTIKRKTSDYGDSSLYNRTFWLEHIKILYVCHGMNHDEYILHIKYDSRDYIDEYSEEYIKSLTGVIKKGKKEGFAFYDNRGINSKLRLFIYL